MKETLAFIGAGVAAVIVKAALQGVFMSSTPGATSSSDPLEVRLAVALVFFGVLIALDRAIFQNDAPGRRDTKSARPAMTRSVQRALTST